MGSEILEEVVAAQKIIIDTDIGDDIDDVIAVSFALRRPELDVVGISTCFGPTKKRGRILSKQLSLLGRDDIPYSCGPSVPITPVSDERREQLVNGSPTEYDFVGDDEEVRRPASDDGIEFLYEKICQHAGEVILVTIGPLTNIGTLFQRHPDAADKLKCMAMMCGEYPGDKLEWNMKGDVLASKIVMDTRTPKFLGTYEMTRRVVMLPAEVERLRDSDDAAMQAIAEQVDLWKPHALLKPGPVVYDVCPMVWCFDKNYFTTESCRIDVITEGDQAGRNFLSEDAAPVEISTGIRENDVLEMLMRTLLERTGVS